MASLKNLYEDEQNKQQTSGTDGVISTDGTQAAAAPVDPNASTAQGNNWTNLDKYLTANEGLGGGIASSVTADGQKSIDSAAGKINDYQAKNATIDKSQTDKLQAYQDQINADPTKVDANAFKTDLAKAYGNNTDATKADGYADANTAYGTANDSYNNLKSDDWSDRNQQVAKTFGKDNGNYTNGQSLLDTFILGGDKAGQQGLKDFADKNAAFVGATDPNTSALASAKGNIQSALDTEKNRFTGYTGANGSLNTALNSKRSGLVSNLDGRVDQVAALNAPLNEQEDVLRAVAEQVAKNVGKPYDPATFLSRKDYSLGDTVSDSERAELDALNSLGQADSVVDTSKYKAGTGQGVTVNQAVIDAGNGYKYDPKTNQLLSVIKTGGTGDLTNIPYYKAIIDRVLKSKGYK